jgi:HSP20 family molecular chaperone IbpA
MTPFLPTRSIASAINSPMVGSLLAEIPLQERSIRAFARRFGLEHPVDADAMTMTYTDGALAVCIPKTTGQPAEQPAMQVA